MNTHHDSTDLYHAFSQLAFNHSKQYVKAKQVEHVLVEGAFKPHKADAASRAEFNAKRIINLAEELEGLLNQDAYINAQAAEQGFNLADERY